MTREIIKKLARLLLILSLANGASFAASDKPPETRLAAFALPSGARADWMQWDSFLTFAIKRLGQEFRPNQSEQLGEVFLDARYQLTQALASGASDPVPQLFVASWDRLSPLLKQTAPGLSPASASQFAGFTSAMDGLKAVAGVGSKFGLVRITPDALRGAAKFLGAANVDPLAYSLDIDATLRTFLGFEDSPPPARPSPLIEQSRFERLRDRASAVLKKFAARSAHAAEADFDRLNQWLPETQELQEYLVEVHRLLSETADNVLAKSKLAKEHHPLYRQIVYAAAWQESCWRQFIKKGAKLTPLASNTGDVGMMQVNRTTWRSLYDVTGLNGDISYNSFAGAEILHHYLTRYAIGKKEDKQPGGHLARATYSAYNAGPGGLGRYRGVRQTPVWKKVDDAFWSKFQAVSGGQELAVKTCYGG
jgi:hypothetical protein